jgi:metal-responsive CopG/Arc/MetJ family transcriptional regulator
MRTVVELPDDQLAALDAWCEAHGVSRAEALRQAIARLLREEATPGAAIEATRGLWANRAEDGLAMQERLRAAWER